jgi:hypothetical protein
MTDREIIDRIITWLERQGCRPRVPRLSAQAAQLAEFAQHRLRT